MPPAFVRILLLCVLGTAVEPTQASEVPAIAVVYNANSFESRDLAHYYAKRRKIPRSRLIGLDLPNRETMSRSEFQEKLQGPLLEKLAPWITFHSSTQFVSAARSDTAFPFPAQAQIRYLALCYGVPLRILNESNLSEPNADRVPPELRKSEAAVDSELALAALGRSRWPAVGPWPNRAYAATNTASLHPTNGVLMVARLDGPALGVAKGLIDKALQAETSGLWGRAYFDARGLTNGSAKLGDDWIQGAAEVARRLGFETVVDEQDARFPAAFPMSQTALYAGWYEYDGHVSGPFVKSHVEFMPGAFAYHLHSFSAHTLRSDSRYWAGPLLDRGATITMGTVHEPYLEFTPNLAIFMHRFIHLGFSFGEAAYASQSHLSWQTTVVGDPLYRPFQKSAQAQHEELLLSGSPLLEWSFLKIVNINLAAEIAAGELIEYLKQILRLGHRPVLLEKLGDLYVSLKQWNEAAKAYSTALTWSSSKLQRLRILLALGQIREELGEQGETYEVYRDLVRAYPDYPDRIDIYRKLAALAEELEKTSDLKLFQQEIERLSKEQPRQISLD